MRALKLALLVNALLISSACSTAEPLPSVQGPPPRLELPAPLPPPPAYQSDIGFRDEPGHGNFKRMDCRLHFTRRRFTLLRSTTTNYTTLPPEGSWPSSTVASTPELVKSCPSGLLT